MTNHPNRRPPRWLADAQTLADQRIAATRWPDGDGVHVLTRDQLAQVIRDAVIYGFAEGLRCRQIEDAPR